MSNYVENKVVIVTGASSGFGKLVSEKVAAKGGIPIMGARRESRLQEIAANIEKNGGKAYYRATDVTKFEDVKALVDLAIEKCGRVDVIVNNAGNMPLAFYSDHATALDAWHNCIDVNLKGTLNGICAVYDQMMAQGRGQVINLSSIYANYPVVGSAVYQATKIGVCYLAESLRQESQGKIKVSVVKPTATPGTELFAGIMNPNIVAGMYGAKTAETAQMQAEVADHPEYLDKESISYLACDPNTLADNIVYLIDQPWGVNISDITVRASNERCIL